MVRDALPGLYNTHATPCGVPKLRYTGNREGMANRAAR